MVILRIGREISRVKPRTVFFCALILLISVCFDACSAEQSTPPKRVGKVVYASGVTLPDMQAAIELAEIGDQLIGSAGSATWASSLVYSKPLDIRGAGIGRTNITIGHTGTGIDISGTDGNPFAFGGFSFLLNSGFAFRIHGTCKNFRIHHVEMNNQLYATRNSFECMYFGDLNQTVGYQSGVIDNCQFINGRPIILDTAWGHDSYKRPIDLGGPDAIYFEDCTFTFNSAFTTCPDANFGGRYVVRYCHFYNGGTLQHSLQEESSYYTGGIGRGGRKVEIYQNIFEAVNNGYIQNYEAIKIRSGTGVVFNNTIINSGGDSYNVAVGIDNDRSFRSIGTILRRADGSNIIDGNLPVTDGTGTHTGSSGAATLTCTGKSWTVNAFTLPVGNYIYNLTDGSRGQITANTATTVSATLTGGTRNCWNNGDSFKITNGYPALDQIGRSTDAGAGTNYQPQALEPLYCWNNTLDGVLRDVLVENSCGHHIQVNRDYYNSGRPGYVPYTYPHPARSIIGD